MQLLRAFIRTNIPKTLSKTLAFCDREIPVDIGCKLCSKRCISDGKRKKFGQPAPDSHPHLLKTDEVNPGLTFSEFKARRVKLLEVIRKHSSTTNEQNHIVILPAAAKSYMSDGILYRYHQNSNMRYFCGFLEPDSVLVLHSSVEQEGLENSVLFVTEHSKYSELWEGACSGVIGAKELTGVDNVLRLEDIMKYLNFCSSNFPRENLKVWYNYVSPANKNLHAHVLHNFIKTFDPTVINSTDAVIDEVRSIKTLPEKELMLQSCLTATKGIKAAMKATKPGVSEAILWSTMEHECRLNGADYLGYIPVVAGGENANTIHYTRNDQLLVDGDLVLMDAGCCHHGYISDVTRTWPVNGKFSFAQRSLYLILLAVQQHCIELASKHNSLDDIYSEMISLLGAELQGIGIIQSSIGKGARDMIARKLCPHHVSHYLGLEVHDTPSVSRRIPLEQGHVITIEPGLYIPSDATDIPAQYRGVGLRIEDDLFITETGADILTESCPKTITDIEELMFETD